MTLRGFCKVIGFVELWLKSKMVGTSCVSYLECSGFKIMGPSYFECSGFKIGGSSFGAENEKLFLSSVVVSGLG